MDSTKLYKVGEYYNFWVKGLSNHRIYLEDEHKNSFSVYAYDFQTEWDWSSPKVPVGVLKCYVKEITSYGSIILEQSKDILLIVLYPEAARGESKACPFVIESLKTIKDNLFYVIRDPFGITHLYKPKSNQRTLQPGDEIELDVTGIQKKDNNKSYLKLEPVKPTKAVIRDTTPSDEDSPIGEFGEETDKVEFKSTIIYPAGATEADIDTQMRVILRTIAGFMNAKGGTLYIGVNDNGEAVGIEQEYSLLNTSSKDRYVYQQNRDGYENKIRSCINNYLSPVAQDYVSIRFSEHNGHIVCSVKVEPSKYVIWYDEREAYKRMGNRTSHLRSEAIVKLILDKMEMQRPDIMRIQPTPVKNEEEMLPPETITGSDAEAESIVLKDEKPAKLQMKGEKRKGHGSFYMNLFANGEWSWSKNTPADNDLEFCIPINAPTSKYDLMMVYEDGCVNRVDAYHLHLNKKENKRYKNGRRNDGVKLTKVFAARENDLLACFCEQDGHEFVKVHPVSHISQHDNMVLMGNRLINTAGMKGVKKAEICFVSAEHDQRVSALKKTENQTANSLGFQMDLQKNAKYIMARNTLLALCDLPSRQTA